MQSVNYSLYICQYSGLLSPINLIDLCHNNRWKGFYYNIVIFIINLFQHCMSTRHSTRISSHHITSRKGLPSGQKTLTFIHLHVIPLITGQSLIIVSFEQDIFFLSYQSTFLCVSLVLNSLTINIYWLDVRYEVQDICLDSVHEQKLKQPANGQTLLDFGFKVSMESSHWNASGGGIGWGSKT